MHENSSDRPLSQLLRRCSTETIECASHFRRTQDLNLLPVIVRGIIARFLEPAMRELVANSENDFHLIDDLGIDSLLRIEIVMVFEEVFEMTVCNRDLIQLETIADITRMISQRFEVLSNPESAIVVTTQASGVQSYS